MKIIFLIVLSVYLSSSDIFNVKKVQSVVP